MQPRGEVLLQVWLGVYAIASFADGLEMKVDCNGSSTNRRLEVGAEATEARAANPGSDVLTDDPGYPSLSIEPNLVTLLRSGRAAAKETDPLDG